MAAAVLAVTCDRTTTLRPDVEPARWDLVAIEDGGRRLTVAVHVGGCDRYEKTEVRWGPRGSRLVVSAFVLREPGPTCPDASGFVPVAVQLDEPLGPRWLANCRPREEDPQESPRDACPLADAPAGLPSPRETVSP